MKTTTYGDHLTQLTRFGAINCYLVSEDDGFTLIDTGIVGSAAAILAAAKTYNMPIVRIVLTHAHGDHVGSLDALHEALPDAEVAITARDARFLAGDRSLDADEPQAKLRSSYQTCKTRPSRLLTQGDHIGSLEVIASPGHTPGHAAFLDLRDHTLIAGDAFQTLGGIAVAGTVKPLFPLPAFGTWHKPTALESAHKLRAIEPARLAVGHGPVLTEPLPEMDRAIAALTQELEKQEKHVTQSRS
jgi:glyoxylase-like metal-dependent hydrolase (beta-lactamase superfamily II)